MDNSIERIIHYLNEVIEGQQLYTRKELAARLKISEKTLFNWLTRPERYPIPMEKVFELCRILAISPTQLISGKLLETLDRFSDIPRIEQLFLDLESNIPPGSLKQMACAHFSAPLQLDPLIKLYAYKGIHRRYPEPPGKKIEDLAIWDLSATDPAYEFFRLRKKRRELFRKGNYIIRQILMRDEFEQWINGDRIFKRVSLDSQDKEKRYTQDESLKWKNRLYSVIDQLRYLLELLEQTWNDQPRLCLRMTRDYFSTQYMMFEQSEASVILIHGNLGYMLFRNARVETFFQNDFSLLWENNTMPELKTTRQWKEFVNRLLELLQTDLQNAPRRYDIRKILQGETSFPLKTPPT